jgi:hypothetical protein
MRFDRLGSRLLEEGGRAQARARGGAAVGAVVEVGRVEEVGVVGHFAPGDDCCVLSSFRAVFAAVFAEYLTHCL